MACSCICIKDKTGTLKTVIHEEDYERLGYKAKGWTVVESDWTKDRKIKAPVDSAIEMSIKKLGEGVS